MKKGLSVASFIIRISLFCVLSATITPLFAYALDFKGCAGCHGEDLAGDAGRMYLHSPFTRYQCGTCHAAGNAAAPAAKNKPSPLKPRPTIDWLADTDKVDTSHDFLLPGDKVGANLVVDLREADGKFSRQKIAVPSLTALEEAKDPGLSIVISDVRVLKVERGIFLSATIGWQTNTLSYGQVRYGVESLSQSSEPHKRLGRQHEVSLHDLKLDRTYRFSVVSTDLFGHSGVSEPLEFSTANPYEAPQSTATSSLSPEKGTEQVIASNFKRVGDDYLLELTLEKPAAVYVGSDGKTRQKAPTVADDTSHKDLSGQAVNSMLACGKCHGKQSTTTHPVNVYPKPGMTIPPEYPTLQDGRITCGSCHTSHSSDYEYLVRKQRKRDLCVGCHKDML